MGKKKSQSNKGGDADASKRAKEAKEAAAKADVGANVEGSAEGADTNSGAYEEDEFELLQVDLGDMMKIKQVMDEAVAASILEQVEEDYRWDNWKLIIMSTACLFAMIAQFAPIPFPESRPVLGFCGSMYFVLSGVLQLIATFIDQDAILLTKPIPESPENKNKEMEKYGLRVRSSMPRFSEWYTVILEFQKPSGGKDSQVEAEGGAPARVEQCWSVGQFFDKEGYFDEEGVMDEVEKLYRRFEAKTYDKSTDEKKNQ